MNSMDLMRIAREYSKLGSACQEQIDRVLDEGPFQLDALREEGRLNPGAMRNARMFFLAYDKVMGEDEPLWPDIETWLEGVESDG